jgi:hypothetical protein
MPQADDLKIAIGVIVAGCFALALGETPGGARIASSRSIS